MKFKRSWFSLIALIASAFTVSGCQNPKDFIEYQFIEEVADSHEDEIFEDGKYIRYGDFKPCLANNKNEKLVELGSAYEVMRNYTPENGRLKAVGDRKLLVIPVQFSDFTIENLGEKPDVYVDNLRKAFFGSSKNNKYVSVAEYYNRSSYGKLRISGKVCDQFFTFPESVEEIKTNKRGQEKVQEFYSNVVEWYEDTYNSSIDEFRIDPSNPNSYAAIYLVYTYPPENATESEAKSNSKSFFWAYTFSEKPLSWSSYLTMNTLAGYPDAHTFIHETGHLFGLRDYYPDSDNVPEPTARIDMMDCSIGDHTALSKMWLDWARPYWVKDSCEIKISALVDKGDLILINDNWNGSVFEEYYLIEFYSPTGLNYHDVKYGNNLGKLPSLPGVKIYHVDARLGYYMSQPNSSNKVFKYYCNEEQKVTDTVSPDRVSKNINIVHDNSTHTEASQTQPSLKCYLYELKLNHLNHSTTGCASNYNLFRTGDSFDNFAFNALSNTNYKVTVTDVTYRDATIKIEKIQEK